MTESGQVDVVIVGGGISGLYTAWRLSKSTNLSVVLLECSKRFGGRYQTCIMPGDFPADMGAMRFLPSCQPLMYHLTQEMLLPIEKLFQPSKGIPANTAPNFYRNKYIKTPEEMKKLYSVRDEDVPYFLYSGTARDIILPPDNNYMRAHTSLSDQLAKDMSVSQYLTLSGNVELLNLGDPHYPITISLADESAFQSQLQKSEEQHPLKGYHCIQRGMERLTEALVAALQRQPNIRIYTNRRVARIHETANGYNIQCATETNRTWFIKCKKLILACNGRGIEHISWSGNSDIDTRLRKLLSKVTKVSGFKIFLTYKNSWWNKAGLHSGHVYTDLPLGEVIAFGQRSEGSEYSTLLAAFTYLNPEIFQGLNHPDAERFKNEVGETPEELRPSKRLVEYVQNQLASVLGIKDIPDPVCAAARQWEDANYQSKIGVDSNKLQWEMLKPLTDQDIYITGDTCSAITLSGGLIGWTEGVLLTAERILHRYFCLEPYVKGIPLEDQWPEEANHQLKSKL